MKENLQFLVDKFVQNPGYLGKGAGFIAKTFNVEKSLVYKAKDKARQIIHGTEVAELQNTIAEQEQELAKYIGSKNSPETGLVKNFESTRPLTPEELKQLAGVDGITTTLGMVWDKLQPSGKWTYSIQIKFLVEQFYTKEELKTRLKEIFPDEITPFKLPELEFSNDDHAMFVYISDDHAGLNYDDPVFGTSYSEEVYEERMKDLAISILSYANEVKKLFIVRLGDEADGYNARTTRYDHPLKSESNKRQFDIYTRINKNFYDTIFTSGAAEEYEIINCNNSNHSGLGFSYILNSAVQFYVEAKYPQVSVRHINEFIGIVEWGNHIIGLTHGKDEEHMKRPMPLDLNKDTDLWLFDYYDNKGYSPNSNWISTVKGDIHKFNINDGKSGRYVNVPSIAGGSPYINHNYGNTKPGALVESYWKFDPNITSSLVRL